MATVKRLGKVVLLGANGMLGHALIEALSDHDVIALRHTDLDITQPEAVLKKMQELQPQIIINAAAYTKVDDCEANSVVANLVNGQAPGYLAQAAKHCSAVFIQYSTDYVFSGQQAVGYTEEDQPDTPINAYGRSKLMGEQAVAAVADAHWSSYYIIRTSWLFGSHGPNFVDTMLTLAETKQELKVVNDQHGSPTYAEDLARATKAVLVMAPPYGIYHLTNSGVCTWYDLAKELFRQIHPNVVVHSCASSEFPRPAARPTYSMLNNTKLPLLRPWQEAVSAYLSHHHSKLSSKL